MTSAIQLHNTLTRRKEPLATGLPGQISLYVCGPTVYNFAHIGNARPAVVFDVLARVLRQHYDEVLYVRNFTDVDDKINAAANAEGVPIRVITDRYIQAFHEDMRALDVLAPTYEPRVTEHIPAIIDLINALLEKGHAYLAEEHVLFDVASYPAYGKLSGRRPEDMLAGARVEVAPYKRSPLDFVLWKPSTQSMPGWESPWGFGRPGWHIECSAMIGELIGKTIDIHGGGQDLIFPHHENEIAQGTCANEELYCRHWVHNSFVTVDGRKMSKSLGNVLLVRDLLEQASGEVIRLALLSTHYRRPLDWNSQRLAEARHTLMRFYESLERVSEIPDLLDVDPDEELLNALGDDLNVPAALTRLHFLRVELNEASSKVEQQHLKSRLKASAKLLGLIQRKPQDALADLKAVGSPAPLTVEENAWIEEKVAERALARQQGDFARADQVRNELERAGILIQDTQQGSRWARAEEPPA